MTIPNEPIRSLPIQHDDEQISNEMPSDRVGWSFANHPRYQVLREIGEGGMGIVFHARDRFLQRDLAIKVLAADHKSRGDLVDRFIEEAQIAGQLQHPGIVPIHDIGKFEDDRPFFAMKLVKGKTLQTLLDNRKSLSDEQQRWIDIFGHVCQAVAFAHSKGVIHRDLKPSNVMVGRFDEVQVMDWGLAKIIALPQESLTDTVLKNLSEESPSLLTDTASAIDLSYAVEVSYAKNEGQCKPIEIDHASTDTQSHTSSDGEHEINRRKRRYQALAEQNELLFERSIVQSIRYSPLDESSESIVPGTSEMMAPLSLTGYGQVVGSLAYMPPEQAQGNVNKIDCRADVFSLGAMLAHILTGKPPYVADSKMERLRMASNAELEPCWERLSSSPFDLELVNLCKWCLSADSSLRPRDASIVADHLSKYRIAMGERLRLAELERAAVEARLQETVRSNHIDRKRRQWAWVATFAGCAFVLSAVASVSWIAMQNSVVKLARSNAYNATLEKELEHIARFDESRMAMQQSLIPIQLGLEQLNSSETVPLSAELNRLDKQLLIANEMLQRTPEEIRKEFNIASIQATKELHRQWAEACNGPQVEFRDTVIRLLEVLEFDSPEHVAESIASLPRWASERARTEILKSIHQYRNAPSSWSSSLAKSPWESSFWSAVEATDIERVMQLSDSEELKSQSLAIQVELATFLVANGARSATDQAIRDMNWNLIYPTSVKDDRGHSLGVTEEGWILSKNPTDRLPARLESKIPAQQIAAFRLETYMGPSMIEGAKWLTEPSDVQDEKPKTKKARGMITAPSIEYLMGNTLLGPGINGIGPENCNLRELNMTRESPQGDQAKIRFNRFLTGHTTIMGNEADFAIDETLASFWALGHREGQQLCSTIFQADSLSSWQWHENLVCNIEAGNPDLWQSTSLGPFRLYYSTDSIDTAQSPVSVAVRVLEDLNQKHPGNVSVLDLLAKANLETGIVAKMNRQASFALASVATVIDPNNSQALRFLADTVLALHPDSDNPDYKRLLSQIDTFENESVSKEVRARVAKYQLDRGDQMHHLLPGAAFEAYQEAQRLDPPNFRRHGRLGYGLLRQGLKAEAAQMARLGIEQTTIDPENLLLYGNIALATDGSVEAFPVFEHWFNSVPTLSDIDELQFVRARVCFHADQVDDGIEVVKRLEGKLGNSPNVFKDAALALARCKRKDQIPWLLDTLARNDKDVVNYLDDMATVRDRKVAWGIAAMAAIELDEVSYLERILAEKAKRFPELCDDLIRTADASLLNRVPPHGPCVSRKNVERLFDLFHRLQPDEPRWIIRSAFLDWDAGRSDQAWSKLQSLATDLDDTGEKILLSTPNRRWDALARVVAAVMRLVDADRDPGFDKFRSPELSEAEISAAQKCLGRVPEGDRDFADWLWWEYRLKPANLTR